MIPQNRPVTTEPEIAARLGVPMTTWYRVHAPGFRQRVPGLFPGSRFLIYDLEQAEAWLEGKPIPALPTEEDPEDLFSDQETEEYLGISRNTVRGYAARGYLGPGKKIHGMRVRTRRELDARRDNAPGRGAGGGRKPGLQKAHPYEGDERLEIASRALKSHRGMSREEIARRLTMQEGGNFYTWRRIVNTARKLAGA